MLIEDKELENEQPYKHLVKALYNCIFLSEEFKSELYKSIELDENNYLANCMLERADKPFQVRRFIINLIDDYNNGYSEDDEYYTNFITYIEGFYFLWEKKFEKAIPKFESLIEHNKNFSEYYILLSYAYNATNNSSKAFDLTNKYFNLFPDNEWNYSQHIISLINLDKFSTDNDLVKKALELYPNSSHLYANIGCFYLKNNNINEGLKYCMKAFEINKNAVGVKQNIFNTLSSQNSIYNYYCKLDKKLGAFAHIILFFPQVIIGSIFINYFYISNKTRPFVDKYFLIKSNLASLFIIGLFLYLMN